MDITAEELYKSILFRAADIYEIDYEDVERDVGQQFDPIIRFMAGATASELERVYRYIDDTETRLQKRLAKVLLPEYFHLPQPAHALATATASSEFTILDETTDFVKENEEEDQEEITFTPVFPTKILPAKIKVIATETKILDVKSRPSLRKKREDKEEAKSIYIGLEVTDTLTDLHGATIFFDLKGGRNKESERARFFAAVQNSQCQLGKYRCKVKNGLPYNRLILEDYLNGNERLQSLIRANYKRHFLSFEDKDIEDIEQEPPIAALQKWFNSNFLNQEDIRTELAKLSEDQDKPLVWLKVVFSRPIEIEQLSSRLVVRLNVFPVVNRKLNGHERGKHFYLQNNSIKWIALQPEGDFVSIRRIYEQNPPEYPLFIFKPFADFKEERKPSYTLRHGGIGRWDDFNAWQRLAYVISILQDNYKANELIEMVADSLSLEDVHSLLGKKISKTASDQKPTKDIYVLLHSGIHTKLQVRVEYWTSQGEDGNNVPAGSILRCMSKHKSDLEKDSISLVTSSIGGRNPLTSTQQLDAMKSALLSRGRIVTREDAKIFCKTLLLDKLAKVEVKDGVGTDMRFDFGMTRLLDVILTPTKKSKKEDDWEGICQQVQIELEKKSASSIPIRVGYKAIDN